VKIRRAVTSSTIVAVIVVLLGNSKRTFFDDCISRKTIGKNPRPGSKAGGGPAEV
jgi:hypothetical protein